MSSNFSYPVTVKAGSTTTTQRAESVNTLPMNAGVGTAVVLQEDAGQQPAGLYVMTDSSWRYALSVDDIEDGIVTGYDVVLYMKLAGAVNVPDGGKAFRNGGASVAVQVPAGDTGVWVTLTPAALREVSSSVVKTADLANTTAGAGMVGYGGSTVRSFLDSIFTALTPVENYRSAGFTDSQTIQAALNSGKALVFGNREYVVNQGETVYNDLCHYMRFNGTTFKIGNGAIVNTDAARTNHTAFMRVRGVQGLVMTGNLILNGNRDNQTYPATLSDFGRGTATIGSAGRRTNGILEFTPATDNLTPCRGIFIDNLTANNAYLNALVFWQTEGTVVTNLRSSNNTVNAIAGGGVTDFATVGCHHYRDGASDAFPTSATPTGYGDRAGTQIREIPPSYNAAAIGMPMIPVTTYAQINRNVILTSPTAEECGVESWFLRGCFPGKIIGGVSRNVGYKRLTGVDGGGTPFFSPAHFWCEFGQYEVDVVAYQDKATTAGWMSPVIGVCYSFSGNGYTSTANPMAIAGDFRSTVHAKGYCGLTSAGAKQNNFAKGVLISSFVDATVDVEGTTDDPVTITNDVNFNTRPPHDINLNATITNSTSDRAVMIQRYQPAGVTVSGAANDLRISVIAADIRSTRSGTDDHALIDMDTTMSSYLIDNFEASNLVLDGTNTAGNFNGVRLRCNGASKNVRVHYKRGVNMVSALRTQGFRNMVYEGVLETCFRTLLVDLGTSSTDVEELDIRGLKTYDITTEFFTLLNVSTRKFKVVRATGMTLKGRTTCKTWGTGSITTTADNFANELGTFYWNQVLNDYGSAAPATNIQDMRRSFSGATPLNAAVPFYAGELVRRTDNSTVYMAKGTAAADWSLLA